MSSIAGKKKKTDFQDPIEKPLPGSSDSRGAWCVYILLCRNNYLYTGITNDLQKRLTAHDMGKGSKFVNSRRPFELKKVIYCIDGKEARILEYSLKKLKRRDKFNALGLEYCDVT